MQRKRAIYVYPFCFQYRVPFHEAVRDRLAARGIDYGVIYSSDPRFSGPRGDLVHLDWGHDVPCRLWTPGGMELRYQHAFRRALAGDLIILQQENGLLVNYPLILAARLLGRKTAYFGHGKNFRSVRPEGWREGFKRFWIDKVDWWFAYTQRSADVVAGQGFPRARITVFNNAVDVTAMRREIAQVRPEDIKALRNTLVEGSRNVGVYVGALYPEKRIEFLIAAARRIRDAVPDFHLLILGGGIDEKLAAEAAAAHKWIHHLGPRFGADKARLVLLSQVLLMPGLVGLVALDSFVYGTPMVTTGLACHSPEFDYIEDGRNGVVVSDPDDITAYAGAVVALLREPAERERLRDNMAADLANYSVERMADAFADGVAEALS